MISSLPVSSLRKYLSSVLPSGWEHYETETIVSELKVLASDILIEKINLTKVLMIKPSLFYQDILFFLHACEVFNGHPTDFSSIPHINSLEAAFAIVDMARLQGKDPTEVEPYSAGVRMVIREILINDGYSYPVWPFTTVGVVGLAKGATQEDMENKKRAIKEYINGNYSQPTS